jgi:RNA polymerase sigma-70 factor (ECF subfamily)
MKATEKAFESVFKQHFKGLHTYARALVKDHDVAEEIVQNLFCRLWEKNRALEVEGVLSSYLYRAVYNDCLNYFRHMKVRQSYQDTLREEPTTVSNEWEAKELHHQLLKALNELPERCRAVFQLSRFEALKYAEIAERLHIPAKTVENEMGKALRLLRVKLVDFLALILFLCQ